jgi:hypothetical protein
MLKAVRAAPTAASDTRATAPYVVMCRLTIRPRKRGGTVESRIVVSSAMIYPLASRITTSAMTANGSELTAKVRAQAAPWTT